MILYHGTTSRNLVAIQQEGLRSRRTTGCPSNWSGRVESKPGFIYLTDAYPVYYALAAVKADEDLLLVKVEVDEAQIYPDEDFIAYAMSGGHGERSRDLIARIDPADYRDHWRESLARNGVACTPSVEPERILAFQSLRQADWPRILEMGGDASPTPMNYFVLGGCYRRSIEALFEHGQDEADR
jgi:hypothetical protein